MSRNDVSMILMVLITLWLGGLTISSCSLSNQEVLKTRSESNPDVLKTESVLETREMVRTSESPAAKNFDMAPQNPKNDPRETGEEMSLRQEQPAPVLNAAEIPRKNEEIEKPAGIADAHEPMISSDLSQQDKPGNHEPVDNPLALNHRNESKAGEEETERDIMEEALMLLDESQKYWVKGELEDALQMLDQAYALLLDTNGNPDIARQKDDLRLLISKRILAIYNSHQSVAKGKRGEIPIVTNGDVEKEIRLFQTVERNFFIASYQRSRIYRPLILRELKKAGLPEELSWLPLVESGYKISALSSARALGLWQFIPSTGYKYGLNRDDWVDERMDVEKSTRAAIDYFKDLHAMFGDWLTVLAGYNCGEGRIIRTIASQHINYLDRFWDLYQRLPYETARYVPRFLATLLIVKDPQKYGIDLGPGDPKTDLLSYEVAEINRSMRLQDIAQKLEVPEETLNILNAELRHRVTPDRSYKLRVPIEKAELLLQVASEIPLGMKPRDSYKTVRGVFIKHKVRQGETLTSIAKKYKTSVSAIRSANRLSKSRLVAGQRLNVPIRSSTASVSSGDAIGSGQAMSHRVQKGDTLSALSKKYNLSITEIRKINGLKSDTLRIGQMLQLQSVGGNKDEGKAEKRAETAGEKEKVKSGTKQLAQRASESTALRQYTIKKGDSLYLIAREHKISLDRLLKLNQMGQKEIIRPGQVIQLQ